MQRRLTNHSESDGPISPKEQQGILDVEKMVLEGRQRDLAEYFDNWVKIPNRLGEWNLRINVRTQDHVAVSRTIVALPLTVRTREIFEIGCLKTLENAGFSELDAKRYFKNAWKKKFVWVDGVISATLEMIEAFQNTSVLDSYEQSGDPRRLAATVTVPKNPYTISHTHFLVAVNMAKCVISVRQQSDQIEHPPITVQLNHPLDPPQIEFPDMRSEDDSGGMVPA